jgi:hypothetical protein
MQSVANMCLVYKALKKGRLLPRKRQLVQHQPNLLGAFRLGVSLKHLCTERHVVMLRGTLCMDNQESFKISF